MRWNAVPTLLAILLINLCCGAAIGDVVEFIPPNDPDGQIYSSGTNDGYSSGRGIVFSMADVYAIQSVSLRHDLTNIELNYLVAEVLSVSGDVRTGQTPLRSGSATVTTNGLEWIEFSFAPLILQNGKNYLIEFQFDGLGDQNLFFNNANVPFNIGPFASIDGTETGDTDNNVMPGIRVLSAAVPEPGFCAICSLGAIGLVSRRRKRA